MPYCKRCGTFMPEGEQTCTGCGWRVGSDARREKQQTPPDERTWYARGAQPGGDGYAGYGNDRCQDVVQNRGIAILCYFGLLMLIPYFLRPNSHFVRYHCNQGLLLLIVDAAVSVVGRIGVIGWAVSIVGGVFIIVCIVKGILNVSAGRCEPLPWIGQFTLIRSE